MQARKVLPSESQELPAVGSLPRGGRQEHGDGDRDTDPELTPAPPSMGGETRISTVTETVHLPVLWLDRLLAIPQELPFDAGEEGLLAALVLALERLVPDVRVAIRLPVVRSTFGSTAPPPRVPWTEPPTSNERVRSVRFFPDSLHERSVTLPGPIGVGALHFASEEDLFREDTAPHVQLLDRAAVVVAQALARQRAEERARLLDAELVTVRAQMVQAEKLASLGQIAAGMVHELNNPLTSIAAYTDFLLRKSASRPGTDPDDVERLRRIAESANRMLRFTRDLVSYSRPSGDVPIAVDVNTVIERALAFCEHEVAGAEVTVERCLDARTGCVRGLPEQLAQVFVNLVTNACHAMARPADGESPAGAEQPTRTAILTVSTERVVRRASEDQPAGEEIMVVVHDTGCGIRKQHLDQVFAPFFTTKGAGKGTGLGLSIVKNIVESHGGTIRAESNSSYGTRFILLFPADGVETG